MFSNRRAAQLIIPLMGAMLMTGSTFSAPQETVTNRTITNTTGIDPASADTAIKPPPQSTHATQQASEQLLVTAAHSPEKFIGKTLVMLDQANTLRVGPVTALRRRNDDQQLYVIVDAKAYFHSPTLFAVALKDIDRMEGDTLVIPEAPGMHLKGQQYYPDDYNDKLDAQ